MSPDASPERIRLMQQQLEDHLDDLSMQINNLTPESCQRLWGRIKPNLLPIPPAPPPRPPPASPSYGHKLNREFFVDVINESVTNCFHRIFATQAPPTPPTIKLKIPSKSDRDKLRLLEPQQITNMLREIKPKGQPFEAVTGVTKPHDNSMVLTISVATVESKAAIPAYLIQIKKKFNFHEITHVPDLFWVKAESFDFSEEAHNELRVWREDPNQLHRLREEWKVHTLCHIRYSYRKLAFGFTDMNEALNMSRTGITILAHTGWMRPFDIRGIPIICVKCSKPRHMKDQCVKEIPRCGSRKDNGDSGFTLDTNHAAWSPTCQHAESRKMHEEAKRYDQLNPEWALRNFQNPPPEAAAKMMAESAVVAALTKLNLDNSSKEKWRATKGSTPRTAPPAAQDVAPAGAQNGGNAVDHDQFAPGQDEVAAGQDQATNVPGQHATTQSQEAVSEQGTATQNQRDVTESHLSPGAETVAPVDKPAINQQQLQCRSRPMPRLEKRHVDEPLPEGGDQDSAKQKGNTKKRKVRREQLDLDATFSERDEGE